MPEDARKPTESVDEASQEGRPQRGRSGNTLRDMVLSMAVLALLVLGLAAVSHSCSFSPGGPSTGNANVPTVDVSAELRAVAGQVRFPLREPHLPTGWRANSDSVAPLGAQAQSVELRVGWISPSGRYLSLSQSNADAVDLVHADTGVAAASATGQMTVDGVQWTIYPGIRDERAWFTNLGPTGLLITGNGDQSEFVTLATAAIHGPVVS